MGNFKQLSVYPEERRLRARRNVQTLGFSPEASDQSSLATVSPAISKNSLLLSNVWLLVFLAKKTKEMSFVSLINEMRISR